MNWLQAPHPDPRESIQRHRLLRPFARQLEPAGIVADDPPLGAARGRARAWWSGSSSRSCTPSIAAILAIPLRANVAIAAAFTLVVNPLTIPPMYYAAYRIGSWELHHDAHLVNPATAARVSGELGRFLFWIHEASGPIALGILTIAVAVGGGSAISPSAVLWRSWLGSKWRSSGRNARQS